MAGTLNDTPGSNRLHIGVFGKTNSGKSSFINAFTHQEVSIVADVAGTTTDPVYKPMEISPLGPCVIMIRRDLMTRASSVNAVWRKQNWRRKRQILQ